MKNLNHNKKNSRKFLLKYFFNPKSIAVIGASRHPEKFGYVILENLIAGFKGKIYPINPGADRILGLKCYPSVDAVKERIELAVIVIPAEAVANEVKNCAKKGIKACIIITSGFSEIGNKDAEEEILNIINKSQSYLSNSIKNSGAKRKNFTKSGMRIVGPNVIGVYDSYSKVDTIFTQPHRQARPGKGSISFISQSGAFGAILMDMLASEGIGLSKFISIGNRIDVDETEMLEYLTKDDTTNTVVIYIESAKKGREFFAALKKATRKKPVIILKAGKTKSGMKAIMSHTGTLAGQPEIYSAILKQSHAIEATKIEDLIDFSKIFASQPAPKGKRVQIITNGGGLGTLCMDELERKKLEIAQPSQKTILRIKKRVPEYVSVSNPMDLSGDADTERFELAINECLKDKNVDAIVIAILLQISSVKSNIVDVIIKAKKYNKPIAVCSMGGEFTNIHKKILEEKGVPTYPTPQRAIKSLAALMKYAKFKGIIK